MGQQLLVALVEPLQQLDQLKLIALIYLLQLLFPELDSELLDLRRQQVPIILPGFGHVLLLEVVDGRRQLKWRLVGTEQRLAHDPEQLGYVDPVFKLLRVLSMQDDHIQVIEDLIALVLRQASSVNQPEVEVHVDVDV